MEGVKEGGWGWGRLESNGYEPLETTEEMTATKKTMKHLKTINLLKNISTMFHESLHLGKRYEQFLESYRKARKRFHDHFMSQMKTIAEFVDVDFVKAFNMFTSDDANYKFAIEISLEPEFFSVPGEYHENTLIVSLINAMLSSRKRREVFNSWASLCRVDTETGKQCHLIG